mgnify:CR=1 FL=1
MLLAEAAAKVKRFMAAVYRDKPLRSGVSKQPGRLPALDFELESSDPALEQLPLFGVTSAALQGDQLDVTQRQLQGATGDDDLTDGTSVGQFLDSAVFDHRPHTQSSQSSTTPQLALLQVDDNAARSSRESPVTSAVRTPPPPSIWDDLHHPAFPRVGVAHPHIVYHDDGLSAVGVTDTAAAKLVGAAGANRHIRHRASSPSSTAAAHAHRHARFARVNSYARLRSQTSARTGGGKFDVGKPAHKSFYERVRTMNVHALELC